MIKKLKRLVVCAGALLMLSGCGAYKEVNYFQDIEGNVATEILNQKQIKVMPHDQLAIFVTCKEPRLSSLFSLFESNVRSTQEGKNFTTQEYVSRYTVDSKGNIDFPVLGELHLEGLTREQVAQLVKNRLEADDLVKDPVVTVEFLNMHISVIGEVKTPGNYSLNNDKTTIFDGLALAGDMTVFGQRDRVFVIREEDGKRTAYQLDFRDKKIFESPVYYLQQNDIIYVQPNKVRAAQSTVNENNWKSASLWMSMASVVTSIAVLVFK